MKPTSDMEIDCTPKVVRTLEEVIPQENVETKSNISFNDDNEDYKCEHKRSCSESLEPLDWGSNVEGKIADAAGLSDNSGI